MSLAEYCVVGAATLLVVGVGGEMYWRHGRGTLTQWWNEQFHQGDQDEGYFE